LDNIWLSIDFYIYTLMENNNKFIPIKDWGFGTGRPFVISGPCGAESEDQMVKTASLLAKDPRINIIRAGIWKPRTRPGEFEGRGEVGLSWLKTVKHETGLPVAVEVAYPSHAEAAIKAGVDLLWIGARTAVNPFMIQNLSDSLRGHDIPVMIKNPVNPDLNLWVGAIERIMNSGITRIAAIHRGFSSYENSNYRNKPNWEIPLELQRKLPGISMICDPSHISGSTEPLQYISQFALDLNYDGLMIESHHEPSTALSDAGQQITPDVLKVLLDNLILRNISVKDVFELSRLEDLRDQIDEIDDEIIRTMAHRMSIARLIGDYKSQNNITIYQPERWDEIIHSRTKNGINNKLTEAFLLRLYSLIHEESIHHQTLMMNKIDKNTKVGTKDLKE
jgi:chorismate mutase